MLIGITIEGQLGALTLDERVAQVRAAAERGFTAAWSSEPLNPDPLTTLALAGREVPRIGLGTAIVHTYPRHPLVLAGQALTVQAAIGNRLSLGIGPGASAFVEASLGVSFAHPGRHMREYLTALVPLLRGERVTFRGETLTVDGAVHVPGAKPPSLLLSALGPVMLKLAGELADGTVTALTGPVALANHVVPKITRAVAAAGRPAPRVVAAVTVSVTGDPDSVRARLAEESRFLEALPSYRAMLDREGAAGIADVAIIGDETAVMRGVRRYAEAGATELIARPIGSEGERTRTIEVLTGMTDREHGDGQTDNAWVISEFRQRGGKVGGRFAGANLVILHTTGAKTGRERLTPLVYLAHDDRLYVFAAGPGLSHHPAWYRNLVAHPDVTVEVGTDTFPAVASVLAGEARSRLWKEFVAEIPELPGWQRDAHRQFPIVELIRKT